VTRAFALDLARRRPTWDAEASFERAMGAADQMYDEDLAPCLAGASDTDRAQLAYVMGV
jgi:hypothetical protein